MEQLAALGTTVLAVASFLWSRLSGHRHLRAMTAQQALIDGLPEGSPTRKNLEEALAITSERYLRNVKEGRVRALDKVRDWGEVLLWVLVGVGGYMLAAGAPEASGLSNAEDVWGLVLNVLAFVMMVFGAVGWGKAMNKAVFG